MPNFVWSARTHPSVAPDQRPVGLRFEKVGGGQAGAAVDAVDAEEEPVDVQAVQRGDRERADQGVRGVRRRR